MGVVYIGDRGTGKTHLAMELANPQNEYVKASSPDYDYEYLKSLLYIDSVQGTRPTDARTEVDARNLEIQVRLPSSYRKIPVDWIDTPGEVWRKAWQIDNPDKWKNFLDTVRKSEGILLILPPYRNIISKPGIDTKDFLTKQQWCNRFNRWLDFFQKDCSQAKRLVICLNKADLFCELDKEAAQLATKNWQERHSYVLQKYFKPIQPQIEQINKVTSRTSVSCFITSIYHRKLLELPWIYLGTFLSY